MDPAQWTGLVRKVYTAAQEICRERGAPQIDPVHLLSALLQDPQQLPTQALRKVGTDLTLLHEQVDLEISKFPAQNPPPQYIGPNHACTAVFRQAKTIQTEMSAPDAQLCGNLDLYIGASRKLVVLPSAL